MIRCKALEGKRNYNLLNRSISNPKERLIDVLFKQEDHRGVGWMIRAMWLRRKDILCCKEKMYKESIVRTKRNNILNKSDPGPMGISQTPIRRGTPRQFNSKG